MDDGYEVNLRCPAVLSVTHCCFQNSNLHLKIYAYINCELANRPENHEPKYPWVFLMCIDRKNRPPCVNGL